MIDPNVARAEHIDAVSVRLAPVSGMSGGASHVARPHRLAVVDVHAVDDDIAHELHCEARSAGDVDVLPPTVDGLEAVHDELPFQLDVHVAAEHYPQRLLLDDAEAQSSGRGVHRVVVGVVRDDVDPPVLPPDGALAKPYGAVRQPLAVALPLSVAPPAVVRRVARPAPRQRPSRVVSTAASTFIPPLSKPKLQPLGGKKTFSRPRRKNSFKGTGDTSMTHTKPSTPTM